MTLLLGLAALALLSLPGEETTDTSSADSDECSRCHGGINTFSHRVSSPAEIPEGSEFVYELTIVNHENGDGNPHQLLDNQFFLDITGESVRLADGEDANKTAPDYPKEGGEFTVSWKLVAEASGETQLFPYMNSTAYYKHKNSKNPDEYRYFKKGSTRSVTVKELPVLLTDYSFDLVRGESLETVLAMEVRENVTDFRLEHPPEQKNSINLTTDHPDWTGTGFDNLSEGEVVLFELNFTALKAAEELVTLSWKNQTGEEQSLQLSFTAHAPATAEDDGHKSYRKISKYLGYLAFISLCTLFVSGARTKLVRERANKLVGGTKNRLLIHCIVAYFAFSVALIHGVYHMFRQESLFIGTEHVFAGDLSVFFMGVVSLNGIFLTPLVKRLGFKVWWLTHLVGSILAFLLAAVHIINLNTL